MDIFYSLPKFFFPWEYGFGASSSSFCSKSIIFCFLPGCDSSEFFFILRVVLIVASMVEVSFDDINTYKRQPEIREEAINRVREYCTIVGIDATGAAQAFIS